jgi:hypothetical protein
MELTEQELRDLLEQQDALEAARLAMLQAMQGNGMGQGEFPGAQRPIGEDPKDAKIVPQRQKGESDPKAQQRITGFMKGGTFARVPSKEVGGAFRQAVQDAPEAIERQRIPNPEAADMVKGYFQKLGGQR